MSPPVSRFIASLRGSLGRLRSDERGVILIMFATVLPVILALTLSLIDYSRATTMRLTLQSSLDAATLAAAKSTATTNSEIQSLGLRMLNANLAASGFGPAKTATFTISPDLRVSGSATFDVPVTVASLVGRPTVAVGTSSEVARSSNSLEVGIALDITGSMAGSPLTEMKSAAKELVDLIVKDTQTPYYSKVALVPYASAVNVGSLADSIRGNLSNGRCDTPGCERYRFYNADNDRITYDASTCVTERTGAEAYTDASPSGAKVGRQYIGSPSGDANRCPAATIMPLTTNRTTLKNSIETYQAQGSTAGHIGLAWAWYMISQNFGSLWPAAESRPAAYDARELVKVVILMTDGEFNTAYADGVLAKDSGFASDAYQINRNATNGTSHNQALSLCGAIKQKGVILYTVGFNLNSNASRTLMQTCATSAAHAYLPSGGTALRDAFRAIAQEINSLRISR
jgi:Flp pilus assembly protein TadG